MSAAAVVRATEQATADAELVTRWCDELALVTEETGRITRAAPA